jgi:hypothetical protein
MIQYKVLFYFSSPDLSLVEIKRTDLPEGSALSDVFLWLAIQNDKMTKLKFVSMNKRSTDEDRTFKQGKFLFNKIHGEMSMGGKNYDLICENPELLPENIINLLGAIA